MAQWQHHIYIHICTYIFTHDGGRSGGVRETAAATTGVQWNAPALTLFAVRVFKQTMFQLVVVIGALNLAAEHWKVNAVVAVIESGRETSMKLLPRRILYLSPHT